MVDDDEGPAWVYREETDRLKLNGLRRDFPSDGCPDVPGAVEMSSSILPLTVSMAFSERYLPQAQAGCRYDRMVKGSSPVEDDGSRGVVSEPTDPDPVHDPDR